MMSYNTLVKATPTNILFISALLSGVAMALSAHSMLSMWMGLELNLFGFIPLIMATSSNQEKEAACKYFLAQAIPSAIFLLALVLMPDIPTTSAVILVALFMKMGIAPCHQWFPSVMNALAWPQAWTLITVQKIAPFFMILHMIGNTTILTSMAAAISSIIGGLGGMNQTQLRPLLAYSSIGHMGWMLGAVLVSNSAATLYFSSYLFIVSTTILSAILLKTNSLFSLPLFKSSTTLSTILFLSFMNMGGLPPFFGFFIKAFVMLNLLSSNLAPLTFFLIIGSVMNLYYYLKVIFINALQPSTHPTTLSSQWRWALLNNQTTSIPTPSSSLLLPTLFVFSNIAATTLILLF